MYARIVFAIMIFSIFKGHVEAQKDLHHFYLKIDGDKVENFDVEYGIISYNEEYDPKRVPIKEIKSSTELIDSIEILYSKKGVEPQFNVFIHGIWADSKFAWEQMIKNISPEIYDHEDQGEVVLLSIIWNSAISYKKGVTVARAKGDYLGSFLNEIVERTGTNQKLSFQCHSMGNRVFQHMLMSSKLMESETPAIDHFISIAADLENDIFLENQPLRKITNAVKDITVYMHNNDRTLGMSKVINNTKRLGLHGPEGFRSLPEPFRVINVSSITDHEDLPSSISNHRYFYMSPTVRKDLHKVVWYKDFKTNKQELEAKRHYKLLNQDK